MVRQQFTRLEPLDLQQVVIDDEFWNHYLDRVRERMLGHQRDQLEGSGCLNNFRIAAGTANGSFQGMWFADSDAYKWIEAASYVLATTDDLALERRIDEVIELIEDAQADDGYINTWIATRHPGKRWTNLSMGHELYCAGHLIEAAVAHHRATGKGNLLAVAREMADCIDEVFGPDGRDGIPGHEGIELALVRLGRLTGDERYLELAEFFVESRGDALAYEFEDTDERAGSDEMWDATRSAFFEDGEYDGSYAQDHAPLREQETAEGHSVRATYLFAGAAAFVHNADEPGPDLYATLETLWENMTGRRAYVTGGIGSTHEGERFTEDFHLPNDTSYAETCAAVGSVFWGSRMFQLSGEARYHDHIERTLYNGFLAGLSLDATEFFYANPLEIGPDGHPLSEVDPERFSRERQEWFECACCPPNAARLIASLGRYVYAQSPDKVVYINQFVGSEAVVDIDGTDVELRQEAGLPWSGKVTLSLGPDEPVEFALRVRVPEWAMGVSAALNGERVSVGSDRFATFDREWADGDELILEFEMGPTRIVAHPAVDAAVGKAAFRRGPVVYCLEGTDHDWPLSHYRIPSKGRIDAFERPDLLGGVTVLQGDAHVADPEEWSDTLYRSNAGTNRREDRFTAVPYYAWANREPGEMRVWLDSG